MQNAYISRDGRTVRVDMASGNLGDGLTHLEVRVEYVLGGVNFWANAIFPRGYRLTITPVTISGGIRSFTISPGAKNAGGYVMLEVADRFNAKKLQAWADRVDAQKVLEAYEASGAPGIVTYADSIMQ